jgi:hypothetical protein
VVGGVVVVVDGGDDDDVDIGVFVVVGIDLEGVDAGDIDDWAVVVAEELVDFGELVCERTERSRRFSRP